MCKYSIQYRVVFTLFSLFFSAATSLAHLEPQHFSDTVQK